MTDQHPSEMFTLLSAALAAIELGTITQAEASHTISLPDGTEVTTSLIVERLEVCSCATQPAQAEPGNNSPTG